MHAVGASVNQFQRCDHVVGGVVHGVGGDFTGVSGGPTGEIGAEHEGEFDLNLEVDVVGRCD